MQTIASLSPAAAQGLLWRMRNGPAQESLAHLHSRHGGLLERMARLQDLRPSARLDRPDFQWQGPVVAGHQDVDGALVLRAADAGSDGAARIIRPGDYVHLEPAGQPRGDVVPGRLAGVSPQDVYRSGRDGRLVYAPRWTIQVAQAAESVASSLAALDEQQMCLLANGELARLHMNAAHIERVRDAVMEIYASKNLGGWHGPRHWARVAHHALALSRAAGADPLVPYLFAWVHDSQRVNDGEDPEHGARAADFVRDEADGLFAFLDRNERHLLADACEQHSNGVTDGPIWAQACWDADRLDLWRVGVEPLPRYLCTPHGRRADVIGAALALVRCDEGWSDEEAQDDGGASASTAFRMR